MWGTIVLVTLKHAWKLTPQVSATPRVLQTGILGTEGFGVGDRKEGVG